MIKLLEDNELIKLLEDKESLISNCSKEHIDLTDEKVLLSLPDNYIAHIGKNITAIMLVNNIKYNLMFKEVDIMGTQYILSLPAKYDSWGNYDSIPVLRPYYNAKWTINSTDKQLFYITINNLDKLINEYNTFLEIKNEKTITKEKI